MAATRCRAVTARVLGVTAYREALALQRELQEKRQRGACPDTLLLTEHEPVITLGRSHPVPSLRAAPAELATNRIEIVQAERGGDITYHGPGQLVAYGIIGLREWDIGVVDYLAGLESAAIGALAAWNIHGERRPGARGVWIEGRKAASVGLNVRRGVTMHGIALNVGADLSGFDFINPCGMPGVEMTSISRELGRPVSVEAAAEAFVREFERCFECDVIFSGDAATLPTLG